MSAKKGCALISSAPFLPSRKLGSFSKNWGYPPLMFFKKKFTVDEYLILMYQFTLVSKSHATDPTPRGHIKSDFKIFLYINVGSSS